MTFVNTEVSETDIARYKLPFPVGRSNYWTRDAERDCYLWGGLGGNPAFGEDFIGKFNFYLAGNLFEVVLLPGEGSRSYSESPYVIYWKKILSVRVLSGDTADWNSAIPLFKEALVAFGEDGEKNKYALNREVRFDF